MRPYTISPRNPFGPRLLHRRRSSSFRPSATPASIRVVPRSSGPGRLARPFAVLLERAGLRTTLLATLCSATSWRRAREQPLPPRLSSRATSDPSSRRGARAVTRRGPDPPRRALQEHRAAITSWAARRFGPRRHRLAGQGPRSARRRHADSPARGGVRRRARGLVCGPAHAREMVESVGRARLPLALRGARTPGGRAFQPPASCSESPTTPWGVDLAGVGQEHGGRSGLATQAQVSTRGDAAADIFLEVLSLSTASGGGADVRRPRRHGRPGCTALAPMSRNRSAGELLAEGVPAAEISERWSMRGGARDGPGFCARHRALRRGGAGPPRSPASRGTLPVGRLVALVRPSSRRRRASAAEHLWTRMGPGRPDVRHTATRLVRAMKADIHPEYVPAHVRCTCGNEFWTRSTKPELHVEICSNCHPFYTGRQKLVDTGGRVERFRRRAARSRKG